MENASKALLMAGAILIGILIASLGVFLSEKISDFSDRNHAELQEYKRTTFNQQFLKYDKHLIENHDTGVMEDSIINIQDIVTLINLAKDSNRKNNLEEFNELDSKSGSNPLQLDEILNHPSYYVKVEFDNASYDLGDAGLLDINERKKLEKLDSNEINELIKFEMRKNHVQFFKCEVYLNNMTRHVNYIRIY